MSCCEIIRYYFSDILARFESFSSPVILTSKFGVIQKADWLELLPLADDWLNGWRQIQTLSIASWKEGRALIAWLV